MEIPARLSFSLSPLSIVTLEPSGRRRKRRRRGTVQASKTPAYIRTSGLTNDGNDPNTTARARLVPTLASVSHGRELCTVMGLGGG